LGTVVSVSGNVTGGNVVTAGLVSATSTITGGNLATGGTASITGDIFGGNILLGGTVSATGNIQGSNFTTSGLIIASGNISGGNLRTEGLISATGNVTVGNVSTSGLISATSTITGGNLATGGTASATGNITGGNVLTGGLISAGGDIITAGSVTVNSGASATAIVNGAGNAVGNIGSSGTYFNRLFAQATTALYADLAEVYKADAKYPPGTVLVFGGDQEVTISTSSHDARIAGVVSTNPAHVMNSGLISKYTVEVGLIGRVPCQVIGPIAAGDRVVSSSRAGVAERLDMQHYQPGVIIGKAVESYNGTGVGTIEVVVGRL
jgi:hypothetical protein